MIDILGFIENPWVRWPLTILIIGGFLAWCFTLIG
jgi:hypothetical protein